MLIDSAYKRAYDEIFRQLLGAAPAGQYDETALPSYTHKNRLMAWLFWKRVDVALSMIGDVSNRQILDFGSGGGVTFKYLHDRNAFITGCDTASRVLLEGVCERLKIPATIIEDLFSIDKRKFDVILALDVFEHIEDSSPYLDKFIALSHPETRLIVSGPTENLWYKAGRALAGFSGHYHVKNIYEVEHDIANKGFWKERLNILYFPVALFRISAWKSGKARQ